MFPLSLSLSLTSTITITITFNPTYSRVIFHLNPATNQIMINLTCPFLLQSTAPASTHDDNPRPTLSCPEGPRPGVSAYSKSSLPSHIKCPQQLIDFQHTLHCTTIQLAHQSPLPSFFFHFVPPPPLTNYVYRHLHRCIY
ncbi:hypothetical protein B0J11DRAFT_229763 [Dendryphion nanum]|uniref:Uncharacterized protein n=1 Tax=Dendryphion nanum TaxID=256645 RepID=A0A9P9E9M4_9PLEO|nr:hypothetical protein B0J11DRAFT_229763 [Dendryphion nanum]